MWISLHFMKRYFKYKNHESWKIRKFFCLNFALSSFRAFVIHLFFGSPLKRDFRFAATGLSGSGIEGFRD